MQSEELEPGHIVYYAGHGLSVVVGKKHFSYPGMGAVKQSAFEVRNIRNMDVPISILESRVSPSVMRFPASKEMLMDALDIARQKKFIPLPFSNIEKDATKTLALNDPKDIALTIRSLLAPYDALDKSLADVTFANRKLVLKGIDLLADDLSMASGLTFGASKDHILSLFATSKPMDVWPALAQEEKPILLEDQVFENAFGITREQALDLDKNPIKTAPGRQDGRVRNEAQLIINAALEQNAASKISDAVKKHLAERPNKQDGFNKILSFAPKRGEAREMLDFAFLKLEEKFFKALSLYALVKAEHRHSISQIADVMALPEEKVSAIINEAAQLYIKAAKNGKRMHYISTFEQNISDAQVGSVVKEAQMSMRPVEKDAPSDVFDETKHSALLSIISDRGPMKGSFVLVADILPADQLKAFAAVLLSKKENRVTIASFAETEGLVESAVRQSLKEALLVFREKAVEANRATYITKEMCEICPEISDSLVFRMRAKQVEEKTEFYTDGKNDEPSERNENSTLHYSLREEIQSDILLEVSEEDALICRMRENSFDAEILAALGSIYKEKGDIHGAIRLYGAALDLADDIDYAVSQNLQKLEGEAGYNYSSDVHFSELEMHLQERMNERLGVRPDFANNFSQTQDEPVIHSDVFDRAPSDQKVPHVTYAIPAEALKVGQRLKMVFKQTASGELEVSMEVELTSNTHTAEEAKPVHKMNGFDHGSGFLHRENGNLSARFYQKADGSSVLHVEPNSQDVGRENRSNGVGPKIIR